MEFLTTALKTIGIALKNLFKRDSVTQSAAIAFYAALSLVPLILILLIITNIFGVDIPRYLVSQIELVAGKDFSSVIEGIVLKTSRNHATGRISFVVASLILLFSSTRIFVLIRVYFNRVWEVQRSEKPSFAWIKTHLLSLGMVASGGFLLLASFLVHTSLSVFLKGFGLFWQMLNFLGAVSLFVLLLTLIFRLLPEAKIPWRYIFIGSLITAFLSSLGNYAISMYLKYAGVKSIYGALGSFVVILVWIYYLTLILFFGAELMHAYFKRDGRA